MDLVKTLASRLGVDPKAAEAIAGAVLGTADSELPDEETATLEGGVPELEGWRASAEETLPEGANLEEADGLLGTLSRQARAEGGLLDALAEHKSGIGVAGLVLLGRLGLESNQAQALIASVTDFLNERLGKAWTHRVLTAAPVLIVLVAMVANRRGFDLSETLRGLVEHDPEADDPEADDPEADAPAPDEPAEGGA